MNSDIDIYMKLKDEIKKQPDMEQLRVLATRMSHENLELKTHELFLRKSSDQIEAFREAFEFCDVELASQCFPNCKGSNSLEGTDKSLTIAFGFDQANF